MLGRLRAQQCTEIIYPDGWHMLLRDLQREVVWNDILAWIDQRAVTSDAARACEGALTEVAAALP
jgi:alpha-beta hydrolase superfamily lysophospholipase